MMWRYSHRFEDRSRLIADRHYNRRKVGSNQFVPPGRCVVLYAETASGSAMWTTSWPFAEFVRHGWPGAWVCSVFRNEGAARASLLITDAVAATRSIMGEPPALGMITFVNRARVRPTMVRGVATWGWTFRRAGFIDAGETAGGLLALRLPSDAMPPPCRPLLELEAAVP